MTNTVRTKVTETAKSELRFCLLVILLFLLPQLVSIRNEDLQTNPDHTRLWLQADNHHTIVSCNPLSVLIWQTFTRESLQKLGRFSGEILSSNCHSVPRSTQKLTSTFCRLLYEIATTRKTDFTTCVSNYMNYARGPP